MYRAYIKNLEDLELNYTDIPHKGHFIYGNLIEVNPAQEEAPHGATCTGTPSRSEGGT